MADVELASINVNFKGFGFSKVYGRIWPFQKIKIHMERGQNDVNVKLNVDINILLNIALNFGSHIATGKITQIKKICSLGIIS